MKTISGISGEDSLPPAVTEAPRESISMVRDPFFPGHRPDPSVHTGKTRHHGRAAGVRKTRPVPVDTDFLAWLAELL